MNFGNAAYGVHRPRFGACWTGIEEVAIGLAVAGAAVSAVSAIGAGAAASAQAGVNAAALRNQADLEQQQGITAYMRQKRQGAIDRGRSIAALAGNGVDVSQGSPLELLDQQAKENEFQAEQVKFQHDERAWQIRMGAVNQDQAGSAAAARGIGSAIGTTLGAGAKIAGQLDLLGEGGGGDVSSPAGGAAPPGAVPGGVTTG